MAIDHERPAGRRDDEHAGELWRNPLVHLVACLAIGALAALALPRRPVRTRRGHRRHPVHDADVRRQQAPVAVDGDYVIAGAGAALSSTQKNMIIAYKLGATGKLPDTVGS